MVLLSTQSMVSCACGTCSNLRRRDSLNQTRSQVKSMLVPWLNPKGGRRAVSVLHVAANSGSKDMFEAVLLALNSNLTPDEVRCFYPIIVVCTCCALRGSHSCARYWIGNTAHYGIAIFEAVSVSGFILYQLINFIAGNHVLRVGGL